MPNINTLSSLNAGRSGGQESGGSSDSEGEDRPPRQQYYVGGSERSGQAVIGPEQDAAARIFEAARRAGAEQLAPEEHEAAVGGSSSRSATFQGGAYRLGGHGQATESVAPPPAAATSNANAPIRVRLYIWQNGFSVDDGPLRSLEDPASRPFLSAVMAGQIPPELLAKYPGRKVDVHMERKSTEFVVPKAKPFAGEGHRVGAVVPTVVGAAAPEPVVQAAPVDPTEAEKLLKEAQEGVKLADGEPTTRIQIRLPNGHRLIGTFGHGNLIEDVRTFAVTAAPELAFQPFQLMTTFPNQVIENEKKSLKDASLLSAVIVAKKISA